MTWNPLRRVILALNLKGNVRASEKTLRTLAIAAVRAGDELPERITEIAKLWTWYEDEAASWIAPDEIAAGRGGRFDACDLRHYLALAARAGVPAVPAREILVLSNEEMEVASGPAQQLGGALRRRLAAAAEKLAEKFGTETPAGARRALPSHASVTAKLFDAMDDVPAGWMVRHHRVGPSTLKALAGCGLAGPEAPEVRFGAELEVGPGWVRVGNRRRVDASDHRIVAVGVGEGPDHPAVFLARPWVRAARFAVGEDPHRHGSQLAGQGMWPCEWRAFVQNDVVTGVSFYYAWAGQASAENAAMAIEVRRRAQAVVDAARTIGAIPVYMSNEFARGRLPEIEQRFPPGQIACTLDFIETEDGPALLEGGPPFTPAGGGHPCGFAGLGATDGVAFRVIDGVSLGEPKSWADPATWPNRDPGDAVLPWEQVEELAATTRPTLTIGVVRYKRHMPPAKIPDTRCRGPCRRS